MLDRVTRLGRLNWGLRDGPVAKGSLGTHEGLGLIPSSHTKKSGAVVYICDPSTGEVGQENPWGLLVSLGCLVSSKLVRDSLSREGWKAY